jgi:hypothetical protein
LTQVPAEDIVSVCGARAVPVTEGAALAYGVPTRTVAADTAVMACPAQMPVTVERMK